MEQNISYSLRLVLVSLVLGAVGDALFQDADLGVNVVIGTLVFVSAIAALVRRGRFKVSGDACWFLALALLAAAELTLRASPVLAVLNTAFLSALVLLGAFFSHTGRFEGTGILGLCRSVIVTAWSVFTGSFQFAGRDIPEIVRSRPTAAAKHGLAIGRGILLVLPLLVLFGGLLSSADPVFAHYLSLLFQWDLRAFWARCFWIAAASALAGGYLRFLLRDAISSEPKTEEQQAPMIGHIEIAVILGALNMLFLLFVLVQFRYFFGGAATVQSTVGMTYAAYARHGFFELVTTASLVLPLLLALHALLDKRQSESIFRGLAGAMVLQMFVLMASALVRMNLYRTEYGLTELRVYTTAFMGWLAFVFLWFVVTVLRGQRPRFTAGACASAIIAVMLLSLWNPDTHIVRANTALSHAGKSFDSAYALWLSADAAPELIADLPTLRPADQHAVASGLLARWTGNTDNDWRSWCWGRWTAQRAVAYHQAYLLALKASIAPSKRTVTALVIRVPHAVSDTRGH